MTYFIRISGCHTWLIHNEKHNTCLRHKFPQLKIMGNIIDAKIMCELSMISINAYKECLSLVH